jgi:sulfite exporter TauE/SafE
MALVGGLILGISARHSEKHPEATPAQKFRPHLFFNLGRIVSYLFFGGLIGLVGKAFQLSGPILGALTIIVGLVMLLLGLQLTGLFPRLANISFNLPASIPRLFGLKKRHEKEYSHSNSALVGALTFFMPCGFTQAMQLFAMSTGSFWRGALIMGAFALGTAPGLLSIGGLTSVIKGTFAKRFFKFAGVAVVALAILNISNGLNLTGVSSKISFGKNNPTKVSGDADGVTLENGFQVVRMTQAGSGYQPNTFTIKKGIPVRWIVDSKDSNTCAASLYSQQLNIKKFLQPGENVFEFNPDKVRTISFSCSMGMYRGSFTVVD